MEKNLGHATAYGYAKSKGYSGTEDEFAELMADYASVGQSAAQSAEQAAASATSASASAQTASQAAQTATSKASEAVTAAGTATTKASEASTSAGTASTAAQTATDKASEATTAATTATTKAAEASESAVTATTAKTDAETARDAAAQSASRAEQSAESIDPDEFNRKIYAAFATDTATGAIASFADGADSIPMKDVLVHIEPVQAGSGDPSPDNVRPITGWTGCVISHSGADMTNPITYDITFPTEAGTVYGGTLDVTSGELVVDRAIVDLGTLRWGHQASYFYASFAGIKQTTDTGEYPHIICSLYKTVRQSVWANNKPCISQISGSTAVLVADDTYTDATTFKTAMSGVQSCYELATPITYHLTPQEITSLLGANNLWADTGDTEVEYRADTTLYISRLTEPDADMIADANIVSGQYFMVGNNLYRATSNIASGASVIVGTNAVKVSLATALNEINQ